MTRYLAIDNALVTSGWALFEDDNLIKYDKFKTSSTDPIEERLGQIIDWLDFMYHEYKFDKILFEDCQQQSNRNVQTFHKLSMVKAMILYWCGVIKMPYQCSSPSHWRSILKDKYNISWGRNRGSQKLAAQEFVKEHFNIKATEDECDAICLGLAGIIENEKPKSAF